MGSSNTVPRKVSAKSPEALSVQNLEAGAETSRFKCDNRVPEAWEYAHSTEHPTAGALTFPR